MHGIQTAAGSDAIAPDTTGLNFYRADPSLRDLLQHEGTRPRMG